MLEAFKIFLFSAASGVLPALVWLLFWLEEDKARPEPTRLIIRGFLAGGVAVIFAFLLEKFAAGLLGGIKTLNHDVTFSLATLNFIIVEIPLLFVWSFIEEAMKLLLAFLFVLHGKDFDEPIDAMIYMVTVAIGFAAIENTLFLLNVVSEGQTAAYFFLTSNMRFLGATIVHIVSSAIVGASLAMAFCGGFWRKLGYVSAGLLLATLLHALFNFFIIINDGEHIFRVLASFWIGALFVIYLFERAKQTTCRPDFANSFLAIRTKLYAKR